SPSNPSGLRFSSAKRTPGLKSFEAGPGPPMRKLTAPVSETRAGKGQHSFVKPSRRRARLPFFRPPDRDPLHSAETTSSIPWIPFQRGRRSSIFQRRFERLSNDRPDGDNRGSIG